jgi:hypothetical protein
VTDFRTRFSVHCSGSPAPASQPVRPQCISFAGTCLHIRSPDAACDGSLLPNNGRPNCWRRASATGPRAAVSFVHYRWIAGGWPALSVSRNNLLQKNRNGTAVALQVVPVRLWVPLNALSGAPSAKFFDPSRRNASIPGHRSPEMATGRSAYLSDALTIADRESRGQANSVMPLRRPERCWSEPPRRTLASSVTTSGP